VNNFSLEIEFVDSLYVIPHIILSTAEVFEYLRRFLQGIQDIQDRQDSEEIKLKRIQLSYYHLNPVHPAEGPVCSSF
jgi:hypothetical protein